MFISEAFTLVLKIIRNFHLCASRRIDNDMGLIFIQKISKVNFEAWKASMLAYVRRRVLHMAPRSSQTFELLESLRVWGACVV